MKKITLPVISGWQPWFGLIVEGIKDWENRPRPIPHKFLNKVVLLHAAKKRDTQEWDLANDCWRCAKENKDCKNLRPFDYYKFGGIVGYAIFDDCIDVSEKEDEANGPWLFGPYGWHVKKAGWLPFLECKGKQGWFYMNVDAEIFSSFPSQYLKDFSIKADN